MNLTIICIVLGVCLLLAIILLILSNIRQGKSLEALNQMLELAISKTLTEKTYDESLLSSIEAKFYQILLSNRESVGKLEEEKDNINQLISDISHQTKTPISNILLYTELLQELDLTEEVLEYITPLFHQAKKLKFLIDSLVKSSRLETGIIVPIANKNKVQSFIDAVLVEATPSARAKNITIQAEPSNSTAEFDTKWTTEALFNLVDNAIKYSPEDSAVTISVKEYEFFTSVCVADEGLGIPEKEKSKVFSRFYRAAEVSDSSGVGIGLYLARKIIELQNGYIKISDNKPKGSIFSIYLPK